MKSDNLFFFTLIFSKGDTLEKKLLRKHIFAVLVLISMVSISFLILTTIIKTQHYSSNLINISGKQRMYTQRVLFYYNKYVYEKELSLKKRLFENLEKLEENNNYLISKLLDRDSISYYDKKLMLLFNSDHGTINKFNKFKSNIESYILDNNNKNKVYIEKQGEELLKLYDEITLQFQRLVEDEVSKFLVLETSLYIISLITILLEALFIFRPAILEVFKKHSELKELNQNLSCEVKKQVQVLREQEQLLIQQSKLAEMGEMLSNISHQWKQPLTILSMQIEDIESSLFKKNINKEDIERNINCAFNQIDLMSNTIEDFKRFYMPDNEKKEFNIYETIKDIVQMEQSALQNYTISHKIKTKDHTIFIHGFESQLKQVLLSLTNNAIEQISKKINENNMNKCAGKIKYTIKKANNEIEICVYDNAGGIPEEIFKNIFTPYFSTKKNKGGSGIGLYMAKTIIEKNFNGELKASNGKKGAKFCIKIPILIHKGSLDIQNS